MSSQTTPTTSPPGGSGRSTCGSTPSPTSRRCPMPTRRPRSRCVTCCAGHVRATRCSARKLGRSGSGPRCWVIDPIDGTKNYVRGVPVWATLIGLMDGPDVVVGVVSAPALGRRWWGALGGGAWTGRSLTKASPCRVSGVTKLGDASMSYSGLGGWSERGLLDNFLGLTRSVWRTRAFGDFWSHMLVAEGACDISAEPEVNAVGPGRAPDHRHRGGRPVHLARGRGHAGRRQRGVHQRPPARRGTGPAAQFSRLNNSHG